MNYGVFRARQRLPHHFVYPDSAYPPLFFTPILQTNGETMVDHVSHRIGAWEYDIRDQQHRFSGKGTIKNIRANICHNTTGTALGANKSQFSGFPKRSGEA